MGYTGFDRWSTYMPTGRAASRAAWLRSRRAKQVYEAALKNKYKPNNKSIEIIGVRDPVLTHITTDSVPGTLTQTTFDTTSRADSAQILFTNSTGASKVIIASWIRGKPVTRLSDGKQLPGGVGGGKMGSARSGARGGFLHDKYVDYERIAQDGDITFETGNNFVVTADQVNKLADYYWKLNRTKKHIYTLSLVGFQSWFEPGEWYTLQIGGAGEAEYIDSTVECFDVRCSLQAGAAPSTSVSFREVEESWKFDSNEVARQIAAGDFSRRPSQNVVTVAAQYYPGYADYYCDGTNDQEEINSAISYVGTMGGTVQLTRGTFRITSSCTLSDQVNIRGEGDGTLVVCDTSSVINVVSAIGTSTTYIKNVTVNDMMFDRVQSTDGCYVRMNYVDGYSISGVTIRSPIALGIFLNEIKNGTVVNNRVGNASAVTLADTCYGIVMQNTITSVNNIIQANIVSDIKSDNTTVGIDAEDTVSNQSIMIANNKVLNIAASTGGAAVGILEKGKYNLVSSNQIVGTTAPSGAAIGLYIASSVSTICSNNYCYNNGADTGLANTNSDNFLDEGTDTQWAG